MVRPAPRILLIGMLVPILVTIVWLARWEIPGVVWLGFSPDGDSMAALVTTNARMPVHRLLLWDISTWTRRASVDLAIKSIRGAYSPNGQWLAFGSMEGIVSIRHAEDGREHRSFQAHDWGCLALEFSPDGRTLATGGGVLDESGMVRLWDVESGQLQHSFSHESLILRIAFSPEPGAPGLLAFAGQEGPVKLGDLRAGPAAATWQELPGSEVFVAFAPDGNTLMTRKKRSGVLIWDVHLVQSLATLPDRNAWFFAVSPDSRLLLTAGGHGDGTVRVWQIPSGRSESTLQGKANTIYALSYSADGQMIATGADDGTIELWDASNYTRHSVLLQPPLTTWPRIALIAVLVLFSLWSVVWVRNGLTQPGRFSAVCSFAVLAGVVFAALWLRVWGADMESDFRRTAWLFMLAMLDGFLVLLILWVSLGKTRWPARVSGCIAGLALIAFVPIATRWQGHLAWFVWDALGTGLMHAAVLLFVFRLAQRLGFRLYRGSAVSTPLASDSARQFSLQDMVLAVAAVAVAFAIARLAPTMSMNFGDFAFQVFMAGQLAAVSLVAVWLALASAPPRRRLVVLAATFVAILLLDSAVIRSPSLVVPWWWYASLAPLAAAFTVAGLSVFRAQGYRMGRILENGHKLA
jgi:WD40 repeat protein